MASVSVTGSLSRGPRGPLSRADLFHLRDITLWRSDLSKVWLTGQNDPYCVAINPERSALLTLMSFQRLQRQLNPIRCSVTMGTCTKTPKGLTGKGQRAKAGCMTDN